MVAVVPSEDCFGLRCCCRVAIVPLAGQSKPSPSVRTPDPGYVVPRTPDGKPDLQGVWANNSVTPMTRPTQWKDKDALTDAEVDELKAFVAQVRRPGRRRDLPERHPAGAQRQGQGQVQADLVRPDDRQLQPVLDGRSRLGQPDVAHHRSAERPVPAVDARGVSAPPRRPAAGAVRERTARSGRRPRGSTALRALHLLRRAAHAGRLQQLHADHPVAGNGRAPAGNDSRRARRADDREAAPAEAKSGSCTATRAAAGKATRSSSRRRTTSTDSTAPRRT